MVTVSGDVDIATIDRFQAAIAEAEAHQPAVLIVDMSAVEFLASAGLQALAAVRQRLDKSARVAVVADGPATSRPIQLTGLDQIFSLYPSLSDAMAALNAGSPPKN